MVKDITKMSASEIREYLATRETEEAQKVEAFRKHIEDKGCREFGDNWAMITGVRFDTSPGSLKGSKAPIKYRDKDGNEWSGRGFPPKVWSFLYDKDGKPLPAAKVKALLEKKDYVLVKPLTPKREIAPLETERMHGKDTIG